MDNKSVTFELEQMITKGLIDQNYKILIRENQQINTEPSPDKISFTCEGSNTEQEVAITNESLPLIVSQDTRVTKTKSNTTCKNIESTDGNLTISNSQTTPVVKTTFDTFCHLRKSLTALDNDKLKANMMAIKSFLMNEIYELRQEISSIQLKLKQEKVNQSGNNNVCEKDEKIIIENLKTKLEFYQRENQLLKDETITKQQTAETILHQSNELLKLHQYYNKNIEQETIVRNAEVKVEKLSKISQESKKQIIGVDESTVKKNVDQIIPYNPKNNLEVNPRKVKNTKNVFIAGDSMIKNITGTEISRSNTVKMKPHPGATTVDICDYIKPELRRKPNVIIIYCGTNDIENEINTVKKIKKLVKEIDEYEKQNPPKVVRSSLIKRYDQDFNDDIANINDKLQRFCNSKGLSFIDDNNIDTAYLNKGNVHLNRRGLSYLANNVKKFVGSLWKSDPIAKVYQNTHKHPKISLVGLNSLRTHNHSNIIISHLNVNSIKNKFDDLKLIIDENVDILCIVQTKIDESFPTAQSILPGYHKPYRLDVTDKQEGLLVYIKSHLPSKPLSTHNISNDVQVIPFELNLRKEKWMFMCIDKPPKQNSQYFLENVSSIADCHSTIYDNYIFPGDFNLKPKCPALTSFMQSFNLFNLIKTNTCFKGKASCIDLILTNRKYCFKHSSTFETGLSDHHHLVYSMLKTCFKREESKIFIYQDYKNFNDTDFCMDLENKLEECPKHYENFEKTFVNVLDAHALRKTKILRGNQNPHVDKNLHKTIMKRSKLKNKANRTKLQDDIAKYKKQRNLVVKFNSDSKLCYFDNIEISKNSKPVWNECKPYFSNKHAHGNSKIILIKKEEITNNSDEVSKRKPY